MLSIETALGYSSETLLLCAKPWEGWVPGTMRCYALNPTPLLPLLATDI